MPYSPISMFRIANVDDLPDVAIVKLADQEDSPTFLVTGGAKPKIIHLTGDHAGAGYDLANAQNALMIAIEGLEFEVEPESRYRPAYIHEPIGAFILSTKGTGITAKFRGRHGFTEVATAYFNDEGGDEADKHATTVGYRKWRAVRRLGDQTFEIFAFESQEVGDR